MSSNGKVADVGLQADADSILGEFSPATPPWTAPMAIGLYVNNVPIVKSTVFADLTEASFTGYSRFVNSVVVTLPTMSAPGGNAIVTFAHVTFQNTGGTSTVVYGYFVLTYTVFTGSGLFTGKLFDSPITLAPGGTLQVITPIFNLSSEF